MATATPPPNQANDAEYAELSKRKLFSILTILKRMPFGDKNNVIWTALEKHPPRKFFFDPYEIFSKRVKMITG